MALSTRVNPCAIFDAGAGASLPFDVTATLVGTRVAGAARSCARVRCGRLGKPKGHYQKNSPVCEVILLCDDIVHVIDVHRGIVPADALAELGEQPALLVDCQFFPIRSGFPACWLDRCGTLGIRNDVTAAALLLFLQIAVNGAHIVAKTGGIRIARSPDFVNNRVGPRHDVASLPSPRRHQYSCCVLPGESPVPRLRQWAPDQ